MKNLRVAAYVLAGDPAWIDVSLRSYYHLVDRIVVSYDERNLSWSGRPLDTAEAIERVWQADPDHKVVLLPGRWDAGSEHPMAAETRQRQAALDLASEGADWVLQLDGDEIVMDPARLLQAIRDADDGGFDAVAYPQRWVYSRVSKSFFLARSRRWWHPLETYEAPQAVRAGTRLTWARMVDARELRLRFGARRRDVNVVSPSQAIAHLCWVRTEEQLRRKAKWSGHANDPGYRWDEDIRKWVRRSAHPLATTLLTPARRNDHARMSLVRIPLDGFGVPSGRLS